MKIIGILGDIGSGKSYVANKFGVPVFNADKEVSKIYKKNKNCYKKLKKNLPKYIKSFPIDKKKLGNAINHNKKNLKKIIKIVHPIVRLEVKKFLKKNKKKRIVVLDIPLLLENKLNKKNYILIFIDAKKNEIKKRLKLRPNYNNKVFDKLRKIQLPLEHKKKKSDYIIKNNFKKFTIEKEIKFIKKLILKK
tara:strand:- start:2759 stop:3334 length:576 start_codon:yes stop_codon:yes gene_type:complete